MAKKIAVVGAGISGLTCAYELQKAGHTVEVFEREAYVGGRMSTRVKDGLPFDIAVNHLVNLYTHMRAYSKELNLGWQPFEFVKYGLCKKGNVVAPFDTLSKLEKIRLAIWTRSIRSVPTDFFDCSSLVAYDTDTGYNEAKRRVGKRFADDLVDTYTSVYQLHSARDISRAGLLSQFNSIRKLHNDWYLQQIPGGMITLSKAFAHKLNVHLETPVSQIKAHDTGVDITTSEGTKTYDEVVVAATPDNTKKIYANPTPPEKDVLDAVKYSCSIVVAFKMPQDTFGPVTGDTSNTTSAIWFPSSESKIISSCSNEAYKGEQYVKDGKTLLLVFLKEEGAKEYLNKSDEEVYAVAKKEVMKALHNWVENDEVLEPHDLYRWPYAATKFYHGYISKVKTFVENHQGKSRVWLCGGYLNSPWTEGALRCGQRVAKQINES